MRPGGSGWVRGGQGVSPVEVRMHASILGRGARTCESLKAMRDPCKQMLAMPPGHGTGAGVQATELNASKGTSIAPPPEPLYPCPQGPYLPLMLTHCRAARGEPYQASAA